jgi:hypothetical protein
MADPTKKSPDMEALLEETAKAAGSPIGRVAAIRADVCVTCRGPANEFKDELSKKEFRISGMCQKCQDGVFGG